MPYDEKIDIETHIRDLRGLSAIAESIGAAIDGYSLGLDIGGGLGVHAAPLQAMAHNVYVTDIIDYNGLYGGELVALNAQKFARHNVPYDAVRTEFHKADAQSLIYRDGMFDLVLSVNAFEHIPDPRAAYAELIRVTKPGALVMLQFDPLWNSAFGHHLWHLNFEPWTHLTLAPCAMHAEIEARGGKENDIHIYDHECNRHAFGLYKSLFEENAKKHFRRYHFDYWSKTESEDANRKHPNFKKAQILGFSAEELLVRGVQFVGIRN